MKKPELLVTPTNVADLQPLIDAGADAFVIGEQRYAFACQENLHVKM